MKRLISALAVIAAVLSFTSCEKDSENSIVGTWYATTAEISMDGVKMEVDISERGGDIEFTFKKDGTGYITTYDDEGSETSNLTYSVSGNMLTLTADGETHSFPFSITENHMTLTLGEEFFEGQGSGSLVLHFEKGKHKPKNSIIGTWKATGAEISMDGVKMEIPTNNIEYTFRRDGTGYITTYDDEGSETSNFTFSAIGDILKLTHDGETEICTFSVKGDYMTITFEENIEGEVALLVLHLEKQ